MGRKLSILFIAVAVLYPLSGVSGTTLSMKFELDPSRVGFVERDVGEVLVVVDGYETTNYLGYPVLPYRVFSVLLPQGEGVVSYHLEVGERVEIDTSIPLAIFEGEYLDDGRRLGVDVDREEVVDGVSVFPRRRVSYLGSGFYRGYRLATFAIYPFRYHMDSGRLILESVVRLVVETEAVLPSTDRFERMRYVDGFREESRREVESMVVNPEMVSSYFFDEVVVDGGGRGFLPSYFPSMEGSEVKYVIVTNEEMAPVFEGLADWKTRKGVPAVVRTVEWISQNYRSGADLAESIRNFIQEAYAKWGVEWVLLGGDTDVIPARYGFVTLYYTQEFIPTDMYYSCLDGTWNADGDSLWAEAYHGASDPGDDADLYSEVYVGRMPASTYDEAGILVGKSIGYSVPLDTLSKEKFLFLAEVIFPSDYHPGDDIILDGAEIVQDIYEAYLEGNPDVTASRLYETCALYPGSICLTKATALDSLDAGTNHVIHTGHGFKYTMSVGDGSIVNYDAAGLTNGDAVYAMYVMSCTNVAFDTDCLAEHFLLNPNGGAFAVTGSSRSAFPSASRPYLDYYYYLLFNYNVVQLGKVHTKSREPYTPSAQGETSDRWTHFIYNYLGDPEVNIFQEKASTFTVNVPPTVGFGPNDVTVEVYSDGSPYDSAFVCLYKEGDDYAYDFTDVGGSLVFEDFLCKSDGYIYVTVTGLNHCRYLDSIQVLQEAGPYLRVNRKSIDDDVVGNDDGVLDAGETVGLRVRLRNTGQTVGEKLYAILKSSETSVGITDSTALYPDIAVGGQSYGLDGFQFGVDAGVEDERSIEFTIEVHDSTGGFWSERFAFEVHAPELELYVNTMSDTLPYGNNDGVIDEGESFLLKIGVKNFGTGTAYGLEGKIRSEDVDIDITDSISTYNDISLLGVEYGDGFVLSEVDFEEVNYYTFELRDAYDRVFSKEMERRKPGSPTGVVLDASFGPTEIHVTWHSPDTLEFFRYLVYHSLDSGGPYDLVSGDLVFHTLFRDYGLQASTVYYYTIVAVDSCGNVGEPSLEASATTNPPQLVGWPNSLGKLTTSSPKIGDIDGDTHPDIVVGAEYIYAWHADGIEIRDGDGQPLTWGILTTEGDDFVLATVALAELDGSPGAEIVGASWNTNEIYIFNHEGDTIPGWPQSTTFSCWASPVVGDVDDDGDLEVIAYDVGGIIYVWHHDGVELLDGDGNPTTNGPFFAAGSPAVWHVSTPALADIDEDGVVEIIACAPDDSIYCLNEDGSAVLGWPVAVEDAGANISASPAVGDVDDDGHLEVVVQSSSARVYALNHDGSWMSGWPKWVYTGSQFFVGSPALGDLTGDGKLEIVIPDMEGFCQIFRYDGTKLPNWPQAYASSGPTESSPIIADIDNDGSPDIILGSEEGILNAWNVDGEYIAGFPARLDGFIRQTPMVKDLDLDGDLELVAACWDLNVYIWDLSGERYYGYSEWNGFHANLHNTGWKEFVGATAVEEMSCTYRVVRGEVELLWLVDPGIELWDLYRRECGGEFELLCGELRADGSGVIRYIDGAVEEGLSYGYRLEAVGRSGVVVETGEIEVPIFHARLYQNHPNPFNPLTVLSFAVPGGSGVKEKVLLVVYDVSGARVRTLVDGFLSGGRYEVSWDGLSHDGGSVASGVYFACLRVGGFRETRKMVLLR